MKKILLLFLALVCITCEQKKNASSDSKQDSIQKYIDLAANDTIDYKDRVKYNDLAFEIAINQKNTFRNREYLSKIGFNNYHLNNLKGFEKTYKYLLDKSFETKDSVNYGNALRMKAFHLQINNKLDSSLLLYIKAEKVYKALNKPKEYALVLLNKSLILYDIGDYNACELTLSKSLFYIKKTNDKKYYYQILNQFGVLYSELGEYDKSLKFHIDALKIVEKSKIDSNDILYSSCFNNIGNVLLKKKDYKNAIKKFKIGLENKTLINKDPELYALLNDNLGYSYFNENDYLKALNCYKKASSVINKINYKPILINIYIHLSEYYIRNGNRNRAIIYSELALNEAKKSKIYSNLLLALKSNMFADNKKTEANLEEYISIYDSIQLSNRKSKDLFAKIELETDEISQQKEIAEKNQFIMAGLSVALFFVGILFFIIIKQRSNRLKMELEQRQQKANEEIYQLMLSQKNSNEAAKEAEKKRIALDLHDGIMNKLASTRLNLSILAEKSDETTITKCLTHISDIYAIEQEIRVIAHNLNNDVFQQENSFVSLLQDFVAVQNETTDTHFLLELDEAIVWNAISSEIKMNLFRIIQEACHNSNKHANANKIIIAFILDENNLCLSINDNGVGFDTQKSSNGIGIQNMKTRVHALGGKITINSFQNHQTSINISVPV
jgi:signal transduction histidine kinase